MRRLLSALLILVAVPAQAGTADLLRDYVFVACLAAAYEAGPAGYHTAGDSLKRQTWWFVENSDAAPETYDRLFTAAQSHGRTLAAETAAVGCLKWRDSAAAAKLRAE